MSDIKYGRDICPICGNWKPSGLADCGRCKYNIGFIKGLGMGEKVSQAVAESQTAELRTENDALKSRLAEKDALLKEARDYLQILHCQETETLIAKIDAITESEG